MNLFGTDRSKIYENSDEFKLDSEDQSEIFEQMINRNQNSVFKLNVEDEDELIMYSPIDTP